MTLADLFEEPDDTDELSPSDQTYVTFRRTVAPGLIDAGFDLTPAKSAAISSSDTGEPITDQTHFRHVLNGAAFGARINRALEHLDPDNALSQSDLLDAFRLYAVHDFHKTEPAQRRRKREPGRDADKDVEEQRARALIDDLRLDEFDSGGDLSFGDYWASILGAEESSGRHRSTSSRRFHRLRHWVRLMDAAAGLDDPSDTRGLERRLNAISSEVELHIHRVDDTKGLATNLLNTSLADRITDDSDVELLVYFANGAVYLSRDTASYGIDLLGSGDDLPERVGDEFVETIRESNPTLQSPDTLLRLLDDSAYQFGYYKFTPMMFLFGGLEGTLNGLRTKLSQTSNPNEYTVYTDAVRFAVGTGLVDSVPSTHEKPQLLGVYVATVFDQLYKRELNSDETFQAINDVATALGQERAGETIRRGHMSSDAEPELSDPGVVTIAESFGESESDARESVRDVTIGQAKKVESQVLALAYLSGQTDEGMERSELPLDELLRRIQNDLLDYYHEWQDHWDDHRRDGWDAEASSSEKCERFERTLRGNLENALPWYVRRYVSVDGDVFDADTGGKFDAYNRRSQARICLTCNDQLVGDSNALSDYGTSGSVVGRSLTYTHFRTLDPANKTEISSPICPMCELEFTLRNAVHDTNTDDDSHYLFLAPDYFHSPVDVEAAKALHDRLSNGSGHTLNRIAKQLVGKATGTRSDELTDIYEELLDERDWGPVLNYDSTYDDHGSLGVFRLDPQSRPGREGDVNRTTQWILDLFAATGFAWLTGSRVILTNSPFPATRFDETAQTVVTEGAPAPVQRHLPTESSVSFLWDVDHEPESFDVRRLAADDAERAEDATGTLHLSTEFGVSLYKLASLLYVTNRAHGNDFQRLTTVLSSFGKPFPGASAVLKEANEAPLADYSALFAATVLDVLVNPNMSDTIQRLAEAGFEVVQPDTGGDVSNYEYERLFRAARDALTDKLARNASRNDLVDIVAGVVMETGRRARQSNAKSEEDESYADEQYTREPAETFAEVFVDEIYDGICDGDFYELRRLENSLASGYNAAIRRHQQEWFDQVSGDDSEEGSNSDRSTNAGDTEER